jgi:hypothetical protein
MSVLVCPRCSGTLNEGIFGADVPVSMCDGCAGMLVAIAKNIPTLRHLGSTLTDEQVSAPLEAHEDGGEERACPQCGKTMDRFSYMGTGEVVLDRCGPCSHLFYDVEEVLDAAVLFTRTQRRVSVIKEQGMVDRANMEKVGSDALRRLHLRRQFR